MFKFKVDNQSYQLPQTPYEVTYKQGLKIKELEKTFGGINYGYKLNVLKMLSGCERLGEVVEEEINLIFKSLPLFGQDLDIAISDTILMSGKKYGLINLDKISVQEFIDIEELLRNSIDLYDVSSSLSAIVYRPISVVRKSLITRILNLRLKFLKNRFIKPYACRDYEVNGYDLEESDRRVKLVEEQFSWGNAIACLAYYMAWKNKIAKTYFLVFEPEDTEEQQGDEEDKSPTMGDMWGMENQIQYYSGGDPVQIDRFKSWNIRKFLRYLSYRNQDAKQKNK